MYTPNEFINISNLYPIKMERYDVSGNLSNDTGYPGRLKPTDPRVKKAWREVMDRYDECFRRLAQSETAEPPQPTK